MRSAAPGRSVLIQAQVALRARRVRHRQQYLKLARRALPDRLAVQARPSVRTVWRVNTQARHLVPALFAVKENTALRGLASALSAGSGCSAEWRHRSARFAMLRKASLTIKSCKACANIAAQELGRMEVVMIARFVQQGSTVWVERMRAVVARAGRSPPQIILRASPVLRALFPHLTGNPVTRVVKALTLPLALTLVNHATAPASSAWLGRLTAR